MCGYPSGSMNPSSTAVKYCCFHSSSIWTKLLGHYCILFTWTWSIRTYPPHPLRSQGRGKMTKNMQKQKVLQTKLYNTWLHRIYGTSQKVLFKDCRVAKSEYSKTCRSNYLKSSAKMNEITGYVHGVKMSPNGSRSTTLQLMATCFKPMNQG